MNDTAEAWHFRFVALPALLMLLSAPGHYGVLCVCLKKYYPCSWGEGGETHLPSCSSWGGRTSPENIISTSFWGLWEYVICSLHKVLWFHHKMLEERLQSLNSALHQASYSSPKSYCIIKARAGFERSHSSAKSG